MAGDAMEPDYDRWLEASRASARTPGTVHSSMIDGSAGQAVGFSLVMVTYGQLS